LKVEIKKLMILIDFFLLILDITDRFARATGYLINPCGLVESSKDVSVDWL